MKSVSFNKWIKTEGNKILTLITYFYLFTLFILTTLIFSLFIKNVFSLLFLSGSFVMIHFGIIIIIWLHINKKYFILIPYNFKLVDNKILFTDSEYKEIYQVNQKNIEYKFQKGIFILKIKDKQNHYIILSKII